MKKRFFTLFALGMMLSGVFSITKAQIVSIDIDSVTVYNPNITNNTGEIYESNIYDEPMLFIRAIVTAAPLLRDTVVNINVGGAAKYLGFPETIVLKKTTTQVPPYVAILTVKGNKKWNMPNSVNGTVGSISVAVDKAPTAKKDTSFVFYNMPIFELKFSNPTVQYPGKLTFTKEGGVDPTKYMRYISYTDGNQISIPRDLTKDFTESEINMLQWNDTIWVESFFQRIAVPLSNSIVNPNPGEGGLNPVLRAVKVPALQNAYFKDLAKGTIYVPSSKDLSFTLVPTGESVGKAPVLKTDRKLTGGEEILGKTWTREKNADGSYTIVIMNIQEPFSILGFEFEEDDNANNDIIDNNNVWAAKDQLYITSVVATNAKIYTVAGALVKTVALAAGETKNVAVPAGFYVVTLDNNSYKVIVK